MNCKLMADMWIKERKRKNVSLFLRTILANDQLDALPLNVFISTPLLVSSSKCSSSGGPICINTPSGITHTSG